MDKFIEENSDDVEMTAAGKLRVKLTGMEFASTTPIEDIRRYLNGRAMRRARVASECQHYDFKKLLPHIVPHSKKKGKGGKDCFMYCMLTGATLPKNPKVLERHVAAKKFRRAVREWEKKKAMGEEERRREEEKVRKRKEYGLMLLKERKEKMDDGQEDGEEGEEDGEDVHMCACEHHEHHGPVENGVEQDDSDTFWVRRRPNFSDIENSMDTDEDTGNGAKERRGQKDSLEVARNVIKARLSKKKAVETAGVKRTREEVKVSKKVRQNRRKRKVLSI